VVRHHLGALALLAALAFPLAASAQNVPAPAGGAPVPSVRQHQQHRHHHHRNRYMHALHKLNLSDAQKQQIAGLRKNAMLANKGADPATRRAGIQSLRHQIDGVLTGDQRSQLHAQLVRQPRTGPKPNGLAPQAPTQ